MLTRIFAIASLFLFSSASFAQREYLLEECINIALERNIPLMQQRLQEEISDINWNQSKFAMLPSLNGNANYGFNFGRTIDPFTNTFAGTRVESGNAFLGSGVDIFNGLVRHNTTKRAKAGLEAAQLDTKTQENNIAMQVALAFLQVVTAEENLIVRTSQTSITELQVQRTERLVDAGQLARGDLLQLQAQLASEEMEVVRAQNDVDLGYLNLTQLMQLSPEEAADFHVKRPDIENLDGLLLESSPTAIYNIALQTMPEIRAAEKRSEVNGYDFAIARGMMMPRLRLQGSLGTGYSGIREEFYGDVIYQGPQPVGVVAGTGELVISDQDVTILSNRRTVPFMDQVEDNFYQSIEFSLSIPIFNGLEAKSQKNIAKINYESSVLEVKRIKDQLRTDVQQAYANAQASMRSYEAAQKAVESLAEAFKYAEVRYEQSVINSVEYSDIKTRHDIAQSQLIQAKYDYIFRIKILDFYQGQPIVLK